MNKKKEYWDMNTAELARATRDFDDPNYQPAAVEPTTAQGAQLRRWQKRRQAAKSRLMLVLENSVIKDTGAYAAHRGRSVSEVVTTALRQYMKKKSA